MLLTGATTSAQTQGAAPKSRWRDLAMTQIPSLSHTKGSTFTLLTHIFFWVNPNKPAHQQKNARVLYHTVHTSRKPNKKHMVGNKTGQTLITPKPHQGHSTTVAAYTNLPQNNWAAHKVCSKTLCLWWFEIRLATTTMFLPILLPVRLTVRLLLRCRLLRCRGLLAIVFRVLIWA